MRTQLMAMLIFPFGLFCCVGIRNECPDYELVNGRVKLPRYMKNDGKQVLEVVCDIRHILKGERIVECKENGQWTARGYCEELDCPILDGLHSSGVGSIFRTELSDKEGTEYLVKCRTDIQTTSLNGNKDISAICFPNGTWLDENVGCMRDCHVTFAEANHINVFNLDDSGYLHHGKALNWTCKDGYEMTSNSSVDDVCNDGYMSEPVCVKMTACHCSNTTKETPLILLVALVVSICINIFFIILICIFVRNEWKRRSKVPERPENEEMLPTTENANDRPLKTTWNKLGENCPILKKVQYFRSNKP